MLIIVLACERLAEKKEGGARIPTAHAQYVSDTRDEWWGGE